MKDNPNITTKLRQAQKAQVIFKKLKELYPSDPPIPLCHSNPWELLVAVVLSAQCTDKKVNEVTQKLFKKYPTFNDYLAANLAEFEMEIRSTGFYRNKAKNILMTARIVADDFGGKIPSTMDELIKLPGVGRKTANVLLGALYGQAVGVVVDTHVKRLAIKFGLTNNTSPETIEKDLMAILPQEAWWEFAHKLKSYGQDYSPAHKKNEESDPISQALVAQV